MNDSAERPHDARRKPAPGPGGAADETHVSPPPAPQFGVPAHYGAAPSSILPPHASFAGPGAGRPAAGQHTPPNFAGADSPYSADAPASHRTPRQSGSSETRSGIPYPSYGTPAPAGNYPHHGMPYPGPSPQPGTPAPVGGEPRHRTPPHRTPEADSIHSRTSDGGEGRIDDFRLIRVLGEGGMGLVYLAEDVRLGRNVAVKLLRRELAADPVHRARFLREAQATAAIEHDHVVPILRIGETVDGGPYLVMPYLQGETLETRLEREPHTPLRHVLQIARETAEGLAAAHARGLVHRDVKPDNLWLEGEPNATDPLRRFRRVRILDFGLARSYESDDLRVTASGAMLGTPKYMSPEQARGQALDPRTDLFSLGVTLYRMTTGRFPFDGPTVMSVLTALATVTPPPPKRSNPGLPQELSDLIESLLRKERTARPDSATEVAAAIRRIEDALDHRRPVGPFPTAPQPESLGSPPSAGYPGIVPGGSGMNLLRPAPGSYGAQAPSPPGPAGSGGYPAVGSGGYPAVGSGGYPAAGSGGYPAVGSGGYPVAPPNAPAEPHGIRLRVGAGLLYVGLTFWSCPLTWLPAWSIGTGGVLPIAAAVGTVVVAAIAVRAGARLLGATSRESVLAALMVGPLPPALAWGWYRFGNDTSRLTDKGWWFLTLWGTAAVLAGLTPFAVQWFFRRRRTALPG